MGGEARDTTALEMRRQLQLEIHQLGHGDSTLVEIWSRPFPFETKGIAGQAQ